MTAAAVAGLVRPQAILFDWDNTLVDSWATIHDALNHVMAAMGKPPWTMAETRARVRLSLRESFPLHFGERWEEARAVYLDRFRAIHLERLTALPGCAAMLATLAGEGIYLGVVSNKTGSLLRLEAGRLDWSQHFGSLVGAGDAVLDKPHPAPVALALEPSSVAPSERVWFVGDTGVDMICAQNAGCVPVLLGGDPGSEELRHAPPRLAFSDPAALLRFLRHL
jgi:phosphoglycolate phosphatase